MNKIKRWKSDIAHLKARVQREEMFLGVYEKVHFIENFFDSTTINITTALNKDGGYISFISGSVNKEFTTLTAQALEERGVNPQLPCVFDARSIINKLMGFENTQEGREQFVERMLASPEYIAEYKAMLIEKSLENHPFHNNSNLSKI